MNEKYHADKLDVPPGCVVLHFWTNGYSGHGIAGVYTSAEKAIESIKKENKWARVYTEPGDSHVGTILNISGKPINEINRGEIYNYLQVVELDKFLSKSF